MHILIVTQYFWPEHFRINEIVEAFVARGHRVTVLTGLPNYPTGQIYPEYRASPQRYTTYQGAKIVRVPLVPRGRSRVSLALNYLSFPVTGSTVGVWKLRGQCFDAIFVFQMSPITLAIPALVLRAIKGCPVALWSTDLWPDSLAAVGAVRSERLLRLLGRVVSLIYSRCDKILVQSKTFIESVTQHGAPPDKIIYFPAWAEGAFETGPAPLAMALAPYRGTFNVMFAGNIGDAQDMPTVLAAAVLLKSRRDIRWLLVGGGRAIPFCRDFITSNQLQDRVILLGQHPIDDMPGFFAGADAMLVSLRAEPVFAMTIPGKVQSYLRAGKPIIAMLGGEGAKIIEDAEAGFTVKPGDAVALAAAVTRMADIDPNARAMMGQQGENYSKREFDRNTLLARLEVILSDLAATHTKDAIPK